MPVCPDRIVACPRDSQTAGYNSLRTSWSNCMKGRRHRSRPDEFGRVRMRAPPSHLTCGQEELGQSILGEDGWNPAFAGPRIVRSRNYGCVALPGESDDDFLLGKSRRLLPQTGKEQYQGRCVQPSMDGLEKQAELNGTDERTDGRFAPSLAVCLSPASSRLCISPSVTNLPLQDLADYS